MDVGFANYDGLEVVDFVHDGFGDEIGGIDKIRRQ